jgi:hypothetical protein
MINRLLPHNRPSVKELIHRLDKVVGGLNVMLLVVAIGLAMVDVSLVIGQQLAAHMPSFNACVIDNAPQFPAK